MLEDVKVQKKVRLTLWGVAAFLSVVSCVIFIFNYRTLQQVSLFSEKNAIKQSENFRYYVNEYKVTKVSLDEADLKIVELTQELEKANVQLTLTRSELTSVQKLNDQLKDSIAVLERFKAQALLKGEALEEMIASFKKKSRDLDLELQGVRKELAVFQPDITDAQEGRAKVRLFKNQIHLVKKNMVILRHKAYEAKDAAQKERDRVEALYGNGGYMVLNGEDKSVTRFGDRRVNIDVKFINK